jgi:3-hydroxyisobutyrate dehydrogenase-like beta-hydroxyacid dehydrogenase
MNEERSVRVSKPRLAFVGVGSMGGPMAAHLLRAGYPLVACDRDESRVAELTALGAGAAQTPRQAAASGEVVLTSLPTSEAFVAAAEDAVYGLLAGLRPGSTLIDMGTTAPPETRRIAALAEVREAAFVDAPVSGGPGGARRGDLSIMVGGDAEHVMACLPILQRLGTPVHCGPVGSGQVVKGINQIVMGVGTALFLEAMAFGLRCQLDPRRIVEALERAGAASVNFPRVARSVADGTALDRDAKLRELPYFLAEAAERDIPMPLTEALVRFMADGEPRLREGPASVPSPWYELMTRGRVE